MAGPEENWKKRYQDSENATKRKEVSWDKREAELKRCISRLSFLGENVSQELDSKLEELRNRVRGEQEMGQLVRLIDIIVDKAEKHRDGTEAVSSSEVSFDASPYLLQWLESLTFPKEHKKQRQKLSKALSSGALTSQVMADFQQLLSTNAATGDAGAGSKSPGMLSRLLGKERTSPETPHETQDDGASDSNGGGDKLAGTHLFLFLLDELSTLDYKAVELGDLAEQAETISDEIELEELVRKVVALLGSRQGGPIPADQALIELVERLDISPSMRTQAKALKSKLLKGITEEELPTILDSLIGLLGQAQQQAERERQEVERFLLKLTQQLLTLDKDLEGIGVDGERISTASRSFTQQVEDHVNHVQTSVNGATELSGLKDSVTEQLHQLQERLKDHKDREDDRISEFEERIDQLKGRIGEMESYAEDLNKSVEDARAEAFKDALTGLNNRGSFDVKLKQEFVRWSRYDFPMSLIVLDVDLFKNVNDTYGHLAGDKVLQVIGRLMKAATREVDFPARYGGEEFVVLLPETDIQAAYKVAEKIRKKVEGKPFHSGGNQVTVTISAGVSTFRKGDQRRDPFARADEALYKAKREGRNRCYKEST